MNALNQNQFEEQGLELVIPEKLEFFYSQSARFKIAYGGRAGAKTETIARILLTFATQKRLRIACFRELQNSIDESCYATLVNCIYDIWKDGSWVFEWDIQKSTIISKRTGSEFIFSGLRYKIESIKSMARIDIAWVEEARNCSKTTLDKLFPTIRGVYKEGETGGPFGLGPEIWISFNPELDSDEIYKRTVKQRDKYFPDYIIDEETGEKVRYAIVVKVNYHDNPFLTPDMKQQIQVAKQASKDDEDDEYLHIWEGHTKLVLAGAVYVKEIKKIIQENRRGKVPYNPNKPVYTFWDLGHSDKTAIWFVQHSGVEYNLIRYYENSLEKMPHYIKYLQDTGYNFVCHTLPHDGDAETLSNVTPKKQLQDAFPNCKIRIVKRPSKKAVGINAVRTLLDLCNFDEENTSEGWACLCNYAYKVNEDNGVFSKEPDHDTPWSHGCFTADTQILTRKGLEAISTLSETGEVWTLSGWKPYLNARLTRKNASLVEVCFINGFMVKCTPDHLFLTESGWKSAELLERGSVIQSGLVKKSNFLKIEYIKLIKEIISKPLVLCIGMYGKMHLGQYQKAVISIIKMKTNLIINYIIWNVYLGKNTYNLAGNYTLRNMELMDFQPKLEKKLPLGINQMKVKNGINLILGIWLKELLNSVYNVGLNFKEQAAKNFVNQNANLNLDLKKEVTKLNLNLSLKEVVKNAVKNLIENLKEAVKTKHFAQINAGKLIIQNVKIINENQDVYCLTVPSVHHFVLSNGAVVHNCDGMQTLALSLKPEKEINKPKTVGSNIKTLQSFRSGSGWMA